MKDKLTAADLALYLGQDAQHDEGVAPIVSAGYSTLGVGYVNLLISGVFMPFGPDDIKPILRPLSDLTEDEATKLYTLLHGGRGPSRNDGFLSCLDYFKDESTWTFREITLVIGFAAGWRYLLSIGIDLFGWIDAGLALDKTKIKTPVQP